MAVENTGIPAGREPKAGTHRGLFCYLQRVCERRATACTSCSVTRPIRTRRPEALHAEIEKARKTAGYADTDSLKSSSNSRPKSITPEKHRELKNTVMKIARETGNIKFCAQVTLHDLARNQEHDDRVLWGANTILGKFNTFLKEEKTYGYAVMDRMPVKTPYDYLKEKFQVGMIFPDKSTARLERVLGLGHGADGTSHLCSVADIMLGAFRYCVNEPDNEEMSSYPWKGRTPSQRPSPPPPRLRRQMEAPFCWTIRTRR
jgi:hypothetical protein